MFASLVKKVTFKCPECNTTIKFDIHSGDNEMQSLFSAISCLTCPKCKESLADTGTEMIRAIYEYNNAVFNLSALEKCMDAELD